jgi:hypothetical protein
MNTSLSEATSFPPCLQARLQGDCVQAARLALCLRPLTALDQEQEPGSTGGEAGGQCGRNIEELIAGEGRGEVGGDHRPFAHFGVFNGHAAPTSLPNDIVSRSVDQQHGNVNRTLSDPTGPPKRPDERPPLPARGVRGVA